MGRWLMMAALAGMLSGCLGVDRGDASRQTIGVSLARDGGATDAQANSQSGAQPDAQAAAQPTAQVYTRPDAEQEAMLDAKARQICTHGYDVTKGEIEPAENNQQIVDWQITCRPYRFMWIF
jgi:hypothetical protein